MRSLVGKKLLFVTYGAGHARMIRPVVEYLLRDQSFEIHILALTTAPREFVGLSVNLIGYKDFFKTVAEVIDEGNRLVSSLGNVDDLEESICYLGANYRDMVAKHGEAEAQRIYIEGGRQAFDPLDSMMKIIATVRPSLVIATNSPRSERAAVRASRALNIPSLALIDMFPIRCLPWFKESDFADKVCVLNEAVKDTLISHGRDASDIVVTGNPAFDNLADFYRNNSSVLSDKRKGIPFTVLWASQVEPARAGDLGVDGDPNLPLDIESELLQIFGERPDWQLVVRNHPNEEPRTYPPFVRVSTQSEDLIDLLQSVHVVVTLTSTVGFQGSIMGTRFITIDKSVFTPTMPFAEIGLSRGVKDLSGIGELLRDAYDQRDIPSEPSYAEHNATGKVVQVIRDVLTRPKPICVSS